MIPAKTKRSEIHQYLPKKIHKWGFKNFVCAGASGIIYNFFLYAGQKSAGREKCGASEVALRLVEELPKTQHLQLFMDNWFSTLPLLSELKTTRILSIATFRSNRLGCPLMSKKDLKKCGHGSFDYRTDCNTGTYLLKWFDNKCVVVVLSFARVECTNTVERYDLAQKVKIDCPDMVSQYNQSMGGVDLADMPITLYRTNTIIRKMLPQTHLPLCWFSESQCLAPLLKALSTKGSLKEIADKPENLHNKNCFCIYPSR